MPSNFLKISCIQLTSTPDIHTNLKTAEHFIRESAAQGAGLIATPENTDLIRHPPAKKIQTALPQKDHPGVKLFSELAQELNIRLLIGSMAIKAANDKIFNRSFFFNADGKLTGTYDKIHLFDVKLPTGEVHRESDAVQAGQKPVIAETPWGGIGMSICYDLRFPYLYRHLAQNGASILSIPAAFTVPTGRAHWETLLRSRAIETGSFVIAPAQTGEHENGRKTWGHTMIIGPWGEILAKSGTQPGILTADLDMQDVKKARAAIPSLQHGKENLVF